MNNNLDRQLDNCIFAKAILTVIIFLNHSLAFWRGDWFNIVTPVFEKNGLG